MSTPEPDEISGSSSSTHDVYSDVMGVLVRTSQQQQPHQEIPIGTALSSSSVLAELLPGHSRNSSGTSHSGSGSASGYGSLASQSQHSRQSSSGELGHFRLAFVFLCAHFSAYCRVDRMVVASLLIWLLLYSLLFVPFFSSSFRCCLFDLGLCFFSFFFFAYTNFLVSLFLFCPYDGCCVCRFPSWPVWSPRFSKLRLSKRGGVGQPGPVVSLLADDGPASNTSSASSGIGGGGGDGGGPDAIRCQSCSHTSPLAGGPRNWRPISPLAGRPPTHGPPKPPSPDAPSLVFTLSPATAAANPSHESSLGHSRYNYVIPVCPSCF